MSAPQQVLQTAATGVAVVERPEDLSAIEQPGCAAVILRRRPEPTLRTWLDALGPEQLPKLRLVLRPDAIKGAVTEAADATGMPEGPERAELIDDIAALAGHFASVMKTPYLRIRLDVIAHDACRRFHIDAITARLVCTYRGTGTQYGISTDGAEPRRVFTVPTGAPIVLRGTGWPEDPPSGLLHRSPPIAGTGETRLVLVLDALSEQADDI